jgi:hypothetical protein
MPRTADSVGLCASCAQCRVVETNRSSFYLCGRSFDDTRFPKYPPLPVRRCIGYDPRPADRPPDPTGSPRDSE